MLIDYTVIGNRINRCRKAKGFTQENIAEKLDISVSFVSRIERGAVKISLETIAKLSNCLDVPPTYFLDDTVRTSTNYLNSELADIVATLSPEKTKLLLEIAEAVSRH